MRKTIRFFMVMSIMIVLFTINVVAVTAMNTDYVDNLVYSHTFTECCEDCKAQENLSFGVSPESVNDFVEKLIVSGDVSAEGLFTGEYSFYTFMNDCLMTLQTGQIDAFLISDDFQRSPIRHCCNHITPVWGGISEQHITNASGMCTQVLRFQILACTNCGAHHSTRTTSHPGCGRRH
jgi:hypothetical protein